MSHQELGACRLPTVPWLPHAHDTGESRLSSQQMMLSNPSLLLGPSSPSESHPCNPWEGISVPGKSRADMRSRAAWCQIWFAVD